MSLGVSGICSGLSGVSACLSCVCVTLALWAWEQGAVCAVSTSSLGPCPIRHVNLDKSCGSRAPFS